MKKTVKKSSANEEKKPDKGRFQKGGPGGPGRPKKTELEAWLKKTFPDLPMQLVKRLAKLLGSPKDATFRQGLEFVMKFSPEKPKQSRYLSPAVSELLSKYNCDVGQLDGLLEDDSKHVDYGDSSPTHGENYSEGNEDATN